MAMQALSFGMIGILIECFFTGWKSMFMKDVHGTCRTTLSMIPVYGFAGVAMERVHTAALSWVVSTVLYMLVIYVSELAWGGFFRVVTGKCPWDYGRGRWTPFGLINILYFPFWFITAACFPIVSSFLHSFIKFVFTNT